jgi:hypothetical protein
MVVILSPSGPELPRRRQALELLDRQKLVAELAVEALPISLETRAVLPRSAGLDIQRLDPHLRQSRL